MRECQSIFGPNWKRVTQCSAPPCRLPVVQELGEEKLKLLPEKWMKAAFDMQNHPLLTTSCPVSPLCPMKSCLKLVFRQVPRLLQLPTGKQSSGISLTRRPGEALLCVSVSLWGIFGCVRIIFVPLCVSSISVQVSQQVRTRPSARSSAWKISSTPRAPLLRRWTGSEQVVICLSKYKHGQNNERGFIFLRSPLNPGFLMTRPSGGLDVWTGGPVRRWQLEFCFFLLCAEAVFAEWDKTWFLWQGKGKPDVPHILGRIQLCVRVCVFPHWFACPAQELFNMLQLKRKLALDNIEPMLPPVGHWEDKLHQKPGLKRGISYSHNVTQQL